MLTRHVGVAQGESGLGRREEGEVDLDILRHRGQNEGIRLHGLQRLDLTPGPGNSHRRRLELHAADRCVRIGDFELDEGLDCDIPADSTLQDQTNFPRLQNLLDANSLLSLLDLIRSESHRKWYPWPAARGFDLDEKFFTPRPEKKLFAGTGNEHLDVGWERIGDKQLLAGWR